MAPALMVTVAGETETMVGSLLVRVTCTVLGAGCEAVTGKLVAAWPRVRTTLDGSWSPLLVFVTSTVADAEVTFAALAVMLAVPIATPVTCTCALVAPVGIKTVAGTVAIEVLVDARFTVKPGAAAAEDSVSVTFWVPPGVRLIVAGGKLSAVPPTDTVVDPAAYPDAIACTVPAPALMPLTCGCVAGVFAPAAMVTVLGVTVTLELLLEN